MKVTEAAARLGFSNEGVMYHMRKGHITATEVAHKKSPRNLRWDISSAEIERFLKEHLIKLQKIT